MAQELFIDENGVQSLREYIPPPVVVPFAVTPSQAKLALNQAGKYAAAVSAVGAAGVEAEIYWTSALSFERSHPLIAGIGAALGLDDDAIDDLFRLAATL